MGKDSDSLGGSSRSARLACDGHFLSVGVFAASMHTSRSYKIDLNSIRCGGRLLLFVKRLEIDSQLLAFFVEMAAFQTECFCGLRNVAVIPLKLLDYLRPLE